MTLTISVGNNSQASGQWWISAASCLSVSACLPLCSLASKGLTIHSLSPFPFPLSISSRFSASPSFTLFISTVSRRFFNFYRRFSFISRIQTSVVSSSSVIFHRFSQYFAWFFVEFFFISIYKSRVFQLTKITSFQGADLLIIREIFASKNDCSSLQLLLYFQVHHHW